MALKPCPECKKDISDSAAACPHCGFAPPKAAADARKPFKLGCLGVGALCVIGLALIGHFFGSDTPIGNGAKVAASLRDKKAQCSANVAELERLGTVKIRDRDGYSVMAQSEAIWAALTHDEKIQQGLLVYCAKMPASGKYSVLIEGLHDGKSMGSIVDGNWVD